MRFMVNLLQKLEAIQHTKGDIIFGELEDIQTIQFMTGGVDLGYDINRVTKYATRLEGNMIIGAYEMSFNKRSQLIYRASMTSKVGSSYFMRKKNWISISHEFPILFRLMKQKAIIFYMNSIRKPINQCKKEDMICYQERADFNQVVLL